MAKGDDVVRRKKNKVNRKKQNARSDSSSSAVSARVAALIAAKKRRKSGVRRQCQGMCFSLPTLDDPFNDNHGKKDPKLMVSKKVLPNKKDKKAFLKDKKASPEKLTLNINDKSLKDLNGIAKAANLKNHMVRRSPIGNGSVNDHQGQACEISDCPSKYLIMCLKEIENSLRHDGTCVVEEDMPLFVSAWGIEFWKSYSAGKDMLDTSGTSSNVEQIAWIVSSAADTISRKDEEGLSYSSPFLLFLVPSQDKATKVRSVCKALKVHGIHSVSIHPGASLDHQIQGLKNCEPEFLISTPERLLELISLKAIDISGVSLLVIDGLEAHHKNGYIDSIKAITKSLSGDTRRLVFNDCLRPSSVPVLQTILMGPVHRLSLNEPLISQKIKVAEDKLAKAITKSLSGDTVNHGSSIMRRRVFSFPCLQMIIIVLSLTLEQGVVSYKFFRTHSINLTGHADSIFLKGRLHSKLRMNIARHAVNGVFCSSFNR